MVTCPEWISGKGNFIDCMHGGSLPDDVINRYCYIQGTFIVPRHVTGSETHREGDRVSHGNDNSQTGVGPYDPRPRNQGGDEIVVEKGVPGDGQAAAAVPLLPGMRQMLNV